MTSVVLTVIGDDRPGLVSALSAPIHAHGASWERSQMARLAGKFAGILLVSVPEEELAALVEDLGSLADEGLHVVLERAGGSAPRPRQRLHLELLGSDHPGIVAEVSATLGERGIGIEELSTDVREAPMAGGMLFEARALLDAPAVTSLEELHSVLEELADELMVEIRLSDA